jgi:hypothetical protein
MNFSFLNNFNLIAYSDWIMALIFLGVALVYGLSMGKNRLVIVTLGVYLSYFVTRAIPWKDLTFLGLETAPDSTVQIFIFLALALGFFFAIPHSAFKSSLRLGGRGRGVWWQILILSILQIGLILALAISFLPIKTIVFLSPLAQFVLVGAIAQFLWLLLPILAIMFLGGNRHAYYDDEE